MLGTTAAPAMGSPTLVWHRSTRLDTVSWSAVLFRASLRTRSRVDAHQRTAYKNVGFRYRRKFSKTVRAGRLPPGGAEITAFYRCAMLPGSSAVISLLEQHHLMVSGVLCPGLRDLEFFTHYGAESQRVPASSVNRIYRCTQALLTLRFEHEPEMKGPESVSRTGLHPFRITPRL